MFNYTDTPVTVKVVCTILSSPETTLQWAATHLILALTPLCTWLIGPFTVGLHTSNGLRNPYTLAEHQRCSRIGQCRSWEMNCQPFD